jgi:hypothetical protein
MSLTTWIDTTVLNTCDAGTIGHRVTTTSTGQKSVVTWECGTQSVLLGESNLIGRKRAVYEVLNDATIIAKIRTLESEYAKRKALLDVAAVDSEVAHLMGLDGEPNYPHLEQFGQTIIESDPYVALNC